MAKISFSGIDDYISGLQKISNDIEPIIKCGVYEGAKVLADAVKAEINALPPGDENWVGTSAAPAFVTDAQRKGLLEGLGLAKMSNDDGFVNTKIGFAGYNETKTKKHPNGQPNAMIARAIISGTSFRQKNNFTGQAARRAKAAAEAAMKKAVDDRLEKEVK